MFMWINNVKSYHFSCLMAYHCHIHFPVFQYMAFFLFFYPVIDICLIHAKHFNNATTAYSIIIYLQGKFSDFIRIFVFFSTCSYRKNML